LVALSLVLSLSFDTTQMCLAPQVGYLADLAGGGDASEANAIRMA